MSHLLVTLLTPLGTTGAYIAAFMFIGGMLSVLWFALVPLYALIFGSPSRRALQRAALATKGRAQDNFIRSWLVIAIFAYFALHDSGRL